MTRSTIPSNNELRAFAKKYGFALGTLAVQTPSGGEVRYESCVTWEHSEKVAAFLRQLVEMGDECERIAAERDKG